MDFVLVESLICRVDLDSNVDGFYTVFMDDNTIRYCEYGDMTIGLG